MNLYFNLIINERTDPHIQHLYPILVILFRRMMMIIIIMVIVAVVEVAMMKIVVVEERKDAPNDQHITIQNIIMNH